MASPDLFAALQSESERSGRSMSWIAQACLKLALPGLASLALGSDEAERMKTSLLRDRERWEMAQARAHQYDSPDPAVRTGAEDVLGISRKTFFMESAVYDAVELHADRLRMAREEILRWAWNQHRAHIEAMDPVSDAT